MVPSDRVQGGCRHEHTHTTLTHPHTHAFGDTYINQFRGTHQTNTADRGRQGETYILSAAERENTPNLQPWHTQLPTWTTTTTTATYTYRQTCIAYMQAGRGVNRCIRGSALDRFKISQPREKRKNQQRKNNRSSHPTHLSHATGQPNQAIISQSRSHACCCSTTTLPPCPPLIPPPRTLHPPLYTHAQTKTDRRSSSSICTAAAAAVAESAVAESATPQHRIHSSQQPSSPADTPHSPFPPLPMRRTDQITTVLALYCTAPVLYSYTHALICMQEAAASACCYIRDRPASTL